MGFYASYNFEEGGGGVMGLPKTVLLLWCCFDGGVFGVDRQWIHGFEVFPFCLEPLYHCTN